MNAGELREAIEYAAAYAMAYEPTDRSQRTGCFVAALTGALKMRESTLSAKVWDLLDVPRDDAVLAMHRNRS